MVYIILDISFESSSETIELIKLITTYYEHCTPSQRTIELEANKPVLEDQFDRFRMAAVFNTTRNCSIKSSQLLSTGIVNAFRQPNLEQ